MRLIKRGERGDTIIEVLFAVTVFALVAVGSLSIMNQGTASAQRALEITLVRQQMDGQAQAIRYVHQAYIASYQKDGAAPGGIAAEWVKMTDKAAGKGADGASEFGALDGGKCPTGVPGEKPFILNARKATVWSGVPAMSAPPAASLPPFSQIIYNDDSSINAAYGMWVEAIPSTNPDGPGFVDFHIRACWDSAGGSAPVTLGTIVRLYEPR
jgi:type II secretory pathway pseudopilin PulG